MKIKALLLFLIFLIIPITANADITQHWAYTEINDIKTQGIMTGTENGFLPDKNITRAEFICAIIRAIKAEPKSSTVRFSDVAQTDFYAPYINQAAQLGLITGFSDSTFRPYNSITRQEAAVVLSRAFGFLSGYHLGKAFYDYQSITEGARDAIGYALKENILAGYPDNTLRPTGTLTRAEAACLIIRSMNIDRSAPGFMIGFPKLADKGSYEHISIEVSTNMPCTVYYMLHIGDMHGIPAQISVSNQLLQVSSANKKFTGNIKAELGKAYSLSLMAVTPDGRRSNVVQLENITPLPYTDGDGTTAAPYGIYTAQQLDLIRFFPDRSFILKKDIRLAGEWEPVSEFYGNFDGNGHRIDGLYIDTEKSYAGLFSTLKRGEVKNLTVDGTVRAKANAGILAGELLDAKVNGCVVSGSVGAITNNAGGFFGESSGRIENCLSSVYLVEASAFAGGIAGQNYGIIRDSVAAVHTVTANMHAGGIASVNVNGGIIERSVAANINVYDMMLDNCGRITSNKKDSLIVNNFAYSAMRTNSENAVNEPNNDNGADISWEELIDKDKLCDRLSWNKSDWSGGSKSEAYLIPHPTGAAAPILKAGISEYAPVRVERATELLGMIDNPDMHYLLVKDISFNENVKWSVAADTLLAEEGFSGTLDGNGYTIRGLSAERSKNGLCGLFGMISGGEVRNLKLNGTALVGGDIMGAIAAINYGNIINCTVENLTAVTAEADSYIGGICGYNYANVIDSTAQGSISSNVKNTVAGGITAHNEGFIDNVSFSGAIISTRKSGLAESVIGGICGYNSGGMLYNASANAQIQQSATTMYAGGVCAIQSDGEIYKCSSTGSITSDSYEAAVSYSGGVCGLSAGGIVMHTHSDAEIFQKSIRCYGGGICGYNEAAIIQCGYSSSDISQKIGDSVYAGGICGYNELGVIASTVALNKKITSYGTTGRICGGGILDGISSSYTVKMSIPSIGDGAFGGSEISEVSLSYSFFTKPISDGGKLGWSSDVWQDGGRLPILKKYTF